MVVLDTNVVSELRKAKAGKADYNVITWAASVQLSSLFLSVITLLELETGILLLERRAILRTCLDGHVMPAFAGRVLPIDVAVAQCCARLHVPDPCSERDALIAATALVHGMTIVTRNTADFKSTAVPTLNPWART